MGSYQLWPISIWSALNNRQGIHGLIPLKGESGRFQQHLNSIHSNISFSMKTQEDSKLPFFSCPGQKEVGWFLGHTAYWKPCILTTTYMPVIITNHHKSILTGQYYIHMSPGISGWGNPASQEDLTGRMAIVQQKSIVPWTLDQSHFHRRSKWEWPLHNICKSHPTGSAAFC